MTTATKKTKPKPVLKSGTTLVAARWWPPGWQPLARPHGMIDGMGIFMYRISKTVGRIDEKGKRTFVQVGEWIVRDAATKMLVGVCPNGELGARFGSSVKRVGAA